MGTPKLFPSLQDASAKEVASSGPSLPKANPGELSEESKNVFTELFGSESVQKAPSMMSAVVQQTEKKGVSYFGKPRTEELSLKKFTAHKTNPGATLLKASILVFFLTGAVFLTQTSSRFSLFGVNPALQVETKEAQVSSVASEVRVQKYLASVLLLDQFSSLADEYLYSRAQAGSAYTSQNKQEEYTTNAEELKPQLVELLTQVQSYMNESIPGEEVALSVAVADAMITQLQAQADVETSQTLLQEVQDLQTAKALLQDGSLNSTLASTDVSSIDDESIQTLLTQFSTLNASLTATINLIQENRREWSVYLDVIEDLTKEVDPLFNTEFMGNLSINSIVFNDDASISISGSSVTNDTKNFTLISNLIDTYEDSEYFENVSERSYQKNDSDEQSYSGSFRITMSIESNTSTNE